MRDKKFSCHIRNSCRICMYFHSYLRLSIDPRSCRARNNQIQTRSIWRNNGIQKLRRTPERCSQFFYVRRPAVCCTFGQNRRTSCPKSSPEPGNRWPANSVALDPRATNGHPSPGNRPGSRKYGPEATIATLEESLAQARDLLLAWNRTNEHQLAELTRLYGIETTILPALQAENDRKDLEIAQLRGGRAPVRCQCKMCDKLAWEQAQIE